MVLMVWSHYTPLWLSNGVSTHACFLMCVVQLLARHQNIHLACIHTLVMPVKFQSPYTCRYRLYVRGVVPVDQVYI